MKPHPVGFLLQHLVESFQMGGCLQDSLGAPTGAGQVGAGKVIRNREEDYPGFLPPALVARKAPEIKWNGGKLPGHLLLPERNSFLSILEIT
jgi:hypothetical protein